MTTEKVLAKRLAKAEEEYKTVIEGMDMDKAITYDTRASFQPDDLVDHPKFGVGKVTEMITPNKMVVMFKEGFRTLVCVIRNDAASG